MHAFSRRIALQEGGCWNSEEKMLQCDGYRATDRSSCPALRVDYPTGDLLGTTKAWVQRALTGIAASTETRRLGATGTSTGTTVEIANLHNYSDGRLLVEVCSATSACPACCTTALSLSLYLPLSLLACSNQYNSLPPLTDHETKHMTCQTFKRYS